MKIFAKIKYEQCICCKELTSVPKTAPVDEREYYIRGCGQLCPRCYKKISQPDNTGKELTDDHVQYLIESLRRSGK